jgi:hypothetical protein|tara:strand:+ start:442 stop:615 length:174 start_codon:yes stop_codon:yes gene_type:complete
MNISLTDVELGMLNRALGAVWWQQNPADEPGQSEAHRVTRIQRKLARAFEHANTEIE